MICAAMHWSQFETEDFPFVSHVTTLENLLEKEKQENKIKLFIKIFK